MIRKKNLQELLPEADRETLGVLPIKSLNLGYLAFGMLTFGFGILIGDKFHAFDHIKTIGYVLMFLCFAVGWFNNRQEDKFLREYFAKTKETSEGS